jgi:branched-chain amino acid transport system ATP-binding protein
MENLSVPVTRPGLWTVDRIFELFPNLGERRESWGRQLSGGEQEMLAIARALLINPKLLLLDEPSQGLAPLLVRDVFRVVASMRKEGISILLVEQNARFGLEVADRVYVLNNGEVIHSGLASDLAKDEERVRALAGVGGKDGETSAARQKSTAV